MSIMNDKSGSMTFNISCAQQVLELLFSYYTVDITPHEIRFLEKDSFIVAGQLNDTNFLEFKDILVSIFCLDHTSA
jgi:hypothetical protein